MSHPPAHRHLCGFMSCPLTLREWLRDAPFTLVMSSGFFGFYAHAGMLTVLEDAGLLPSAVAGLSAGALVGAAWAAGRDASSLGPELFALRRDDFWDPAPGPGLLRGARFRTRLEATLPVRTFDGCRVPLSVSVHDLLARRPRALVAGDLAPAVHASCAVPALFHPVWLGGRPHIDGGVSDRPGLLGVSPGSRVLFHHLASRSPWRRRGSSALALPRRPHLTSVVLHGLPRVGPFRLSRGPHAFSAARSAMEAALDRPIVDTAVHVEATSSSA